MLDRLRQKIEEIIGRLEARRTPTADDVDRLLHQMRAELIDLRARLPRIEEQVNRLQAGATNAVRRAEDLREEADRARARGDEETARARMDEARHALTTAEDLHRRTAELRAELVRFRTEADEKASFLRDARRNRDALLARARRTHTRRTLEEMVHGPDSGLRRFDRIEQEIQDREDRVAASREVQEELEGPGTPELESELRQLEGAEAADDVDRRLRELKREMLEGGE